MTSYLGLTVTSLLAAREVTLTPLVSVTRCAAKPGAFIDPAADLAWRTGRSLTEFVLDRQLIVPKATDAARAGRGRTDRSSDRAQIGHGYTPQRARHDSTLGPRSSARTVTTARGRS